MNDPFFSDPTHFPDQPPVEVELLHPDGLIRATGYWNANGRHWFCMALWEDLPLMVRRRLDAQGIPGRRDYCTFLVPEAEVRYHSIEGE